MIPLTPTISSFRIHAGVQQNKQPFHTIIVLSDNRPVRLETCSSQWIL